MCNSSKPVKLKELTQVIQRLLALSPPAPHERAPRREETAGDPASPVIFVVDDDSDICESIRNVLEGDGRTVEAYAACETFLRSYRPGREACLLIDAYLPGMSGLELLSGCVSQAISCRRS